MLATRYEQLREHARHGGQMSALGAAVLLRQGVAAWMTLVATEEAAGVTARDCTSSTPSAFDPPPPARSDLLAAFTDLLVAALTTQEAS